jgi:ATP-dependent Clp protease ATP-binding subunit ClpC
MINFDFQSSGIYKAVRISKNPIFKSFKFFKILFLLGAFGFFLLFIINSFASGSLAEHFVLLGFAVIFLAFAIIFFLGDGFFRTKVKKPQLPEINPAVNLAEFLSFETAKALYDAIAHCKKRNIFPINPTIFLYFLLKQNPDISFVLHRLLLSVEEINKEQEKYFAPQKFQDTLSQGIYSEKFEQSIEEAIEVIKNNKHQRIEKGDMVQALVMHEPVIGAFLLEADLRPEDVRNLISWQEKQKQKQEKEKRFWEYENLMKAGSIGRGWSAGYSLIFDQYSLNWNFQAQREEVISQEFAYQDEIEQAESILSSPNINNVLLIGEPGVGMKNIVKAIALKSSRGQSSPQINYQRVLELRIPQMLAHLKDPEEVEQSLDAVFREVEQTGNIILVIDDFHNYMATEGAPGTIDITGMLASYLNLPQFQVIAITSYAGLHKKIEQNPSILNMFSKVEVKEPTPSQTLRMLQDLVPGLEAKYNKIISYPALEHVVDLTGRYISNVPFPKKAREALEETVVLFAASKEKWILPIHIDQLISKKTEIPVGKLEEKEKETLLQLEELIHQRIINQEEAVTEVSAALRRARAQLQVKQGPMGGFLFLGPTGVGKTETSKALADIYFGSEKNIIRLDMSEFQSVADIPRIIGGPGETGLLTTPVRENPFSLVLLDEVEKAHLNVLNLFLQVLDEGHITDGMGRKVDFSHTIIICTSNAGYEIILQALKENSNFDTIKKKLLDYLFEKAIFRPELINRFDAVVIFKPLSRQNLLDIAHLMLKKIEKGLAEKYIEFVITEELKERVVDLGYDITFGARNLKRMIQEKVEDPLAEALLRGDIKKGDVIEVSPHKFKVRKAKGRT